jgi:hypothetical protein
MPLSYERQANRATEIYCTTGHIMQSLSKMLPVKKKHFIVPYSIFRS